MFSKLIKSFITSAVQIYTLRITIALCIGYLLLLKFPEHQMVWTMISIILVISPEGKNSKKLSIERFKSNLVGSIAGIVCLEIQPTTTFISCLLGAFLTIAMCYIFKILDMTRVALVALLIILIQPQSGDILPSGEVTPILRTLLVTIGCGIGLAITVFTSVIIRGLKRKYGIPLK